MGTPLVEGATVDDEPTIPWWPPLRRIDGVGVGLILAFSVWVAWASRANDGEARSLVLLLLAVGLVAALARWATHFHGTGAPALLVAGVVIFAIVVGDQPPGLGPEASAEAAGALYAIGTGAAALVLVRAQLIWARLGFGAIAVGFAALTWGTGSTTATASAVVVVVSAVVLLAMPMRERRWVIVWPGLVAVVLLIGTLSYASVPLPADLLFGAPGADRVERWNDGLDAVTEEPLYGVGRAAGDQADAADTLRPTYVRHEPLQVSAESGLLAGLLLLALVWWTLTWVARPGGGPGSVVAGVVIAGSVAHACLEPIWHVPAVPLTLAALAGTASMRGGAASWRLEALWERVVGR